jgi:hypothetical protein
MEHFPFLYFKIKASLGNSVSTKHITFVKTFRSLIKKIHNRACEVFVRIPSFSCRISYLNLSVWLGLVIRVLLSTDITIRKYLVEIFLMNENLLYFECNRMLKIEIYSLQSKLNLNPKFWDNLYYYSLYFSMSYPKCSKVKCV